jgi:hypothetical protein
MSKTAETPKLDQKIKGLKDKVIISLQEETALLRERVKVLEGSLKEIREDVMNWENPESITEQIDKALNKKQ